MSQGEVAGTGNAEKIIRLITLAEQSSEIAMDRATTFAIAPAWHDDRTRDDSSATLTSPSNGREERGRIIGLPVGQEQFSVRGDGMNHLGTEDAMSTIASLQVLIEAERPGLDARRQAVPEEGPVIAEARIEDRDFDTFAGMTRLVPFRDVQIEQVSGQVRVGRTQLLVGDRFWSVNERSRVEPGSHEEERAYQRQSHDGQ